MTTQIDTSNQNYIKDSNPYERLGLKTKTSNSILSFYMKYNQLKNIYRQGWLKVRIGLDFKDKCESVADHSFSVALLALTIIEENKLDLDTLKCMKMAIVHDLGEVYLGDFTPYDNITKIEKHHQERKAILNVLENLNEDNDFFAIWEEFEKSESAEAKLIKNVDSLEFLLQACAYGFDAKYFKKSLSKITEPHCKEIALAAVEATKGNKKPKVVG